MRFPVRARYDQVMTNVNKFFVNENITDFPVNPFEVIKNNKWGLITYSELAEIHQTDISNIVSAYQSEDGYTMYDGENYTIAYNDTIASPGRIRFTLMHEIGHIYMNHLIDFEATVLFKSTLTHTEYKILENEVNAFARNVLAPAIIVRNLQLRKKNQLISYFKISRAAAKVRLETLELDLQYLFTPFIRVQLKYFKNFIHNKINSNQCLNCNHSFVYENAIFCPVCGQGQLIKGEGDNKIIYSGYNLDENGRAKICPRCENEQLENGDYCKICGVYTINKCGNYEWFNNAVSWECGTILDGNARFCTTCGHKSTFFENGLLDSWDVEKREREEEEHYRLMANNGVPF